MSGRGPGARGRFLNRTMKERVKLAGDARAKAAWESGVAETVDVVEADSYVQLALWREFSKQAYEDGYRTNPSVDALRVPWEQLYSGRNCHTVGKLEGREVNISVDFVRVDGRVVAFWDCYSWVVDYAQIKAWLRTTFPSANHTDAMNFNPRRDA